LSIGLQETGTPDVIHTIALLYMTTHSTKMWNESFQVKVHPPLSFLLNTLAWILNFLVKHQEKQD